MLSSTKNFLVTTKGIGSVARGGIGRIAPSVLQTSAAVNESRNVSYSSSCVPPDRTESGHKKSPGRLDEGSPLRGIKGKTISAVDHAKRKVEEMALLTAEEQRKAKEEVKKRLGVDFYQPQPTQSDINTGPPEMRTGAVARQLREANEAQEGKREAKGDRELRQPVRNKHWD